MMASRSLSGNCLRQSPASPPSCRFRGTLRVPSSRCSEPPLASPSANDFVSRSRGVDGTEAGSKRAGKPSTSVRQNVCRDAWRRDSFRTTSTRGDCCRPTCGRGCPRGTSRSSCWTWWRRWTSAPSTPCTRPRTIEAARGSTRRGWWRCRAPQAIARLATEVTVARFSSRRAKHDSPKATRGSAPRRRSGGGPQGPERTSPAACAPRRLRL